MVYRGRNGQNYKTIEPALGQGGEGAVYGIEGMPDYVLKVFNSQKRTETRHRKILAMIKTPMPADAMKQVTWPVDVVYDQNQFVGYVMPSVKNCEALNVMYSDKYNLTLAERIGIAKNLCAAINAVHKAGQVCGDLNPNNIKVNPKTAIVTLIDTDSYHITEPGTSRTFRCEVGLPEYLAKEVQDKMQNGMTLANSPLPTFSKNADLFALAVHIFALLMNGCHPYACAKVSNGAVNIGSLSRSQPSVVCPQPIANIQNGFFPFAVQRSGLTIPRYAPQFSSLPKEIQDLFIRAFLKGTNNPAERPDSVEWFNALARMQKNLKTCQRNPRHMYSTHLQQCPWCEVEKKLQPPQPKPQPQLQLQPKSISRFGDKRGLRIIKMAVAVLLIFLAVKSLNSTNPNSIHAVDKNEAGAQNTAAYNETAVSPVGRIANGNVVIANWYVPYMKYTDSVSNVTSLKVNLEIWGITSGTPYGQWQLYYRDESGKWIASERFNVQNETTRVVLSFQEPITFDALSIIRCSKELCYHSYEFDFSDFRAVAE